MEIKGKTVLMKRLRRYGSRLSIDWIHNLVYYGIENKIFIFNMTDRRYQYMVVEEEEEEVYVLIDNLTVNPLDSILFY